MSRQSRSTYDEADNSESDGESATETSRCLSSSRSESSASAAYPEYLHWIPRRLRCLFVDPDSLNLALKDRSKKLTLFDVSGPAVRLVFVAFAMTWANALALPFLLLCFWPCGSSFLAIRNLAVLPSYLLYQSIFVICMALVVEVCALRKVLPMFIDWLGPLSWLPSFIREHLCAEQIMPFKLWALGVMGETLINQADIVLTANFIGKSFHLALCPQLAEEVNGVWRQVLSQCLISSTSITMLHCAIALYAAFLLQPLLACLTSCPARPWSLDYNYQSMGPGYENLICERIWHADALQTVTTAGRMASFQQIVRWKLERAMMEVTAKRDAKGYARFCQILSLECRQHLITFIVRVSLTKTFHLEFMATLLALNKSLTHTIDFVLLTSLGTSSLVSLIAFARMLLQCRSVHKLLAEATQHPEWEAFADDDGHRNMRQATCYIHVIAGLVVGFFLALLHVWAKAVNVFLCEDGFWNLGKGCADVKLL